MSSSNRASSSSTPFSLSIPSLISGSSSSPSKEVKKQLTKQRHSSPPLSLLAGDASSFMKLEQPLSQRHSLPPLPLLAGDPSFFMKLEQPLSQRRVAPAADDGVTAAEYDFPEQLQFSVLAESVSPPSSRAGSVSPPRSTSFATVVVAPAAADDGVTAAEYDFPVQLKFSVHTEAVSQNWNDDYFKRSSAKLQGSFMADNLVVNGENDIENQYLMESMKGKLDKVPLKLSKCSIHRVPEGLREVSRTAYIPQLVSIGPLHHGKENLVAMEAHKWRYMRDFLCRTPDPEISLEECGKTILGLKQDAINCYAETIKFESRKFVEILLVDGCFILELLLKFSIKESREEDDPLFDTAWMITALERDLILLENQIPFSILESLFSSVGKLMSKTPSKSLVEYAFSFFNLILNMDNKWLKEKSNLSGEHLLDLLRNSYLPPSPPKPARVPQGKKEIPEFIHCATELRRAGIIFKKGAADNLFNIKFSKGVLEIPAVRIQDTTESLLRNLIALEQCYHKSSHHIGSYAIFVDCLINSTNDVALLQRKRIIANYLGGEEDVSVIFNTLSKEVVVDDFYFADLCKQVDAYYNARRHIWKAKLRRDYFSNPWAIISVLAAILLLGLTILQAVYAVLSYYPH